MTGKQLIQIVPRRAKTPEGVGDYSRLLAEQMLADYDINTKFLSGTALRAEQKLIDKWETETVSSRTQSGLLEAMKSRAIA